MPRPKRAAISARSCPIHGSAYSSNSDVSANPSVSGAMVRRSSAGVRFEVGIFYHRDTEDARIVTIKLATLPVLSFARKQVKQCVGLRVSAQPTRTALESKTHVSHPHFSFMNSEFES